MLFSRNSYDPSAAALSVKAYLEQSDGVESSYNFETHQYEASPNIARWHNCREQGFVITMTNESRKQINIAFFEHRNSDEICAIVWEQQTLNPPTIDSADFGGKVYSDKYDVSHTVKYDQSYHMAYWIMERLSAHWSETANTP